MASNTKFLFTVFGPQGSGKTTQARSLAERLNLPFFDTGEQLRAVAARGGSLGDEVASVMESGELVNNEILEEVVDDFLKNSHSQSGIVMDGFPRNLHQYKILENLEKKYGWKVVGITINISDETTKDRLSKRFEVVNGQKVIRDDDQPAIIERRLQTYREETIPILELIKTQHQLLEIDGEPPIDVVTDHINKEIDRLLVNAKN